MTTVVNNPSPQNDSGGGVGMIVGLIVLLVFGYLFFIYGIPALQQMRLGSPQIVVPSTIDVNINQKSE